MKFVSLSKTNKDKSTEIFPPLLTKPTYTMRMCIAESHKRSAKGSNFKKDDRVLPLYMFLLYGSESAGAAICHMYFCTAQHRAKCKVCT